MKTSEKGEPISRHMGFPPSISSNYNYPPHTTGKEQETTKMTNTEGTLTENEMECTNWLPDSIHDRYRITYHYLMGNGLLAEQSTIESHLFTIPNTLRVWAKHGVKVIITSIEQITEGDE